MTRERIAVVFACLLSAALPAAGAAEAGFRLNPGNPRCFLYQNKPVVLITATEHYGAVLNGDFDYVRYLDVLAADGLNLSRLFTFYRELEDSIASLGYANTLAPRPGREVMPWMRTGPGGMADGGMKFDLTRWNPAYFDRLKDFLRQAARRNVIVELVFFCNPYDDKRLSWFPFHRDSNVNGVGGQMTSIFHFMERRDPGVFEAQRAFVRKIVQELNEFDNLYFEISNETSTRRKEPELAKPQVEWHVALARFIREVESRLPKRHLIAVNAHQKLLGYMENGQEYTETGDAAYFDEPAVDIINYHYISRKAPGKGLAAIDSGPARAGFTSAFFKARRHVRKPMVFDENYAGVVRGAPADWDRNRMEAWETILSGGAGFDHLDWSFTPQDPTGSGQAPVADGRRLDGRALRAQLGRLASLWRDCGPDRMRPDDDLIASSPENTQAFASTRSDGRLHVIYVADARNSGFGSAISGRLRVRLTNGAYAARSLPSGALEWKALAPVKAEALASEIELPSFQKDCVLVLEKSGRL